MPARHDNKGAKGRFKEMCQSNNRSQTGNRSCCPPNMPRAVIGAAEKEWRGWARFMAGMRPKRGTKLSWGLQPDKTRGGGQRPAGQAWSITKEKRGAWLIRKNPAQAAMFQYPSQVVGRRGERGGGGGEKKKGRRVLAASSA